MSIPRRHDNYARSRRNWASQEAASYYHELSADCVDRPTRTFVLPGLCPEWSHHTLRSWKPQPVIGTANLIPVTNATKRLHEEFKRRIKTQTVLPSAETAAMLFWALMASGQISMRKIDGWQTLITKPLDQQIDLAA